MRGAGRVNHQAAAVTHVGEMAEYLASASDKSLALFAAARRSKLNTEPAPRGSSFLASAWLEWRLQQRVAHA
jgi:hypothetical protein